MSFANQVKGSYKVVSSFDDALNSTQQPNHYYTTFDALPPATQKKLQQAKPVVDKSSYTVYEPTAFLRIKNEEIEGEKYDFEIHLGKIGEDKGDRSYNAQELAEQLADNIEIEDLDVYVTRL